MLATGGAVVRGKSLEKLLLGELLGANSARSYDALGHDLDLVEPSYLGAVTPLESRLFGAFSITRCNPHCIEQERYHPQILTLHRL